MSTPEHRRPARRAADLRVLLVAAFVLGALVSAVVAVAIQGRGSDQVATDRGGGPAATGGAPTSSRTPARSPSSSPSRSTSADQAEQRALMTQPLSQLRPGDRVVYNMRRCHFRRWVGGQDVALIGCTGHAKPFQVRTEYLVPVEPSSGD